MIMNTEQPSFTSLNFTNTSPAMDVGIAPSPPFIKALKIIPLVIIIVTSLGGNLLLVHAVYSDLRMRTATNYFIVSQCIADLGTTVLVIPFALFAVVHDGWVCGQLICTITSTFNMCFTIATLLNLAVIAFDRFLAIVKTSHHTVQTNTAGFAISLVWFSALVGAIPWLALFSDRVEMVYFPGFYTCAQEFKHPIQTTELAGLVVQIFIFAFLPFAAIVYSFYRILKVIRGSRQRVTPAALSNAQKIAITVYSKTAYTSLTVIATSLIQVFPSCFLMTFEGLLIVYIPYELETTLKWIMWCHCWIKPVIYARRNRQWSRKLGSYLFRVSHCYSCHDFEKPAPAANCRRSVFKVPDQAKPTKDLDIHPGEKSARRCSENWRYVSKRRAWTERETVVFDDIANSKTKL